MIKLNKSLLDVYVCLEVSEKLVQILPYRSLCDRHYWDLGIA